MSITYIQGDDNTVADALSRLPPDCFPDECLVGINANLSIIMDKSILLQILARYKEDEFCKHVAASSMKGWHELNGLWYIGMRLLIPHVANLRENLFQLAHDTLGHFGADKSYVALRGTYYWTNMHHDLEQSYIPSCADCLCNKSCMTQPPRPLHPLPIPNSWNDSVAMDFVGPLPKDNNSDCILTITDCLGSDI